MTFLQALVLGIVQGITEFFPVSSSAHLRLVKFFFQIPDGEHLLYFDLLCHAGTLLALIIFLRRDVLSVLTSWKQIGLFTLALAPLIPGYFFLKPVRLALSDPAYLGFALLTTSVLLFLASRQVNRPQKWTDVIWIGIAQVFALIPGISRSGSTIAAARFCGWGLVDAAKFSFLLAVPTILGGEALESWKMVKGSHEAIGIVSLPCYAAGFFSAFGIGLFSVRAVFWIYEKNILRPFAWYCLGAGLIALAIFHG